MKIYVGCACSVAILDDVIGHFVLYLVTVVTHHMFRPACLYLGIDHDLYTISVLMTTINEQ